MQSPVVAACDDQPISQRTSFRKIRYANCWEDADILCSALRCEPGMRILSIGSAGDNALALLAEGTKVVAADLSPAQLACLEVRVAAFQHLDYQDVLKFLGVESSRCRLKTYSSIESHLSPAARSFWRHHPTQICKGVIHAGQFEEFFRTFRSRVLPLIHSRARIERLLVPKTLAERDSYYTQNWNNYRWQFLFRLFFSRFSMSRLGRDPEFFRYVEGSIADRILQRTRHALVELQPHDNPYLNYILTGTFRDALPRYLRPDKYDAVRAGLQRLSLHCGPIEVAAQQHAATGFDGFNLSDIFEYLSEDLSRKLYEDLLAQANPGARFAYWNTFVPRCSPKSAAGRVRHLSELSESLFSRDKAFFYGRFLVDEVL